MVMYTVVYIILCTYVLLIKPLRYEVEDPKGTVLFL